MQVVTETEDLQFPDSMSFYFSNKFLPFHSTNILSKPNIVTLFIVRVNIFCKAITEIY